ncbi:substrate-binding domain-containing protein [Phaeobacter gallaeciensis]|uniref:substrate-binding domain-containing protein n=1 Tax=Phaeobacter gallaeciensis TaxID=60890 RepID=UPI00237F6DEE|nr:substrate-binding domain-containing protein [Phaeobacter gallaeciensis]MDE4192897.1 substrate-binding domain-containing protein [Phaeobacter gallaeciensis]MDE4198515.1 substrate-binding domain-containing protein [Phaeobacter gallaeciensis]MDE4202660.1 substrate-binding domain-containing protein [Phaeobacter gallaeciensis]MDE4206044.1 substrate-binding domain-containing protein [Phaeobacter gallaeciensis]MDE4214411.1 substrate-binding domain-containing protein [Phaeobacter gallaeciensis]
MAFFRAAICAALLLSGTVTSLAAQDVTLSSPDGAVEITGNLLGFDGEYYRVDTKFGELTVDGSGVSCDGPGCPSLSDYVAEITLSGSSTMAEVLLPALIEGFALRNGYQTRRDPLPGSNFEYVLLRGDRPAARFDFFVSNTDEGFADLLADEADIVMALREIRPAERERAQAAGMGDMTGPSRSRVLALDAMVPLVSPENPVQRISLPQLVAILSGEITNWSELGGADAPISLHLPVEGSGLAQAVEDKLLAPAKATLMPDLRRHDRHSTMVRMVATDPFALAIGSFANTGTARALTLTGPCGFSLRATRRSIKTEDYPLTSPMFLYLPERRLPKVARDFLSYVRGPGAQIVIRRAGFVDQAPERVSIAAQGDRLANAIEAAGPEVDLEELQRLTSTLRGLQRLTTSFRFEPGSTRPDAQSRSNIEQLGRALEAGIYDSHRLLFVGFSDGVGPAETNRKIAIKRANAVRDAVAAAAETANLDRVEIDVAAFGEALPMACDDSAWGREVNRRVEVWVR